MKPRILAAWVFALAGMAAISTAARLPERGHTWPDTWPWFVAASTVCLLGLILWRVGLRPAASDSAGVQKDLEAMRASVRRAHREAHELDRHWDVLHRDARKAAIDRLIDDSIGPFVEQRALVLRHYGMRRGAELLLAMAAAERNFNRTWSATADACPAEARAAFRQGLASLDELAASLGGA